MLAMARPSWGISLLPCFRRGRSTEQRACRVSLPGKKAHLPAQRDVADYSLLRGSPQAGPQAWTLGTSLEIAQIDGQGPDRLPGILIPSSLIPTPNFQPLPRPFPSTGFYHLPLTHRVPSFRPMYAGPRPHFPTVPSSPGLVTGFCREC